MSKERLADRAADETFFEWTGRTRAACHRSLLAWALREGRSLPWRHLRDGYRVWISEIMLQQTTVVAVVPFFERFIARFPDVQSLAKGTEEEVLRLWEGLGYYSRARNLHRCAQAIASDYNGEFPDDVAELAALPGIGRYTAGAIRSFAFNLPAAIVEANTQRLYCRLTGFTGDPKTSAGQQHLWRFAEVICSRQQPAAVNEALMDLGATVCTPQGPRCGACPLVRYCVAAQRGLQAEIPRAAARPAVTKLHEIAVVIGRGREYLLRQHRSDERWAGLWGFVRFGADEIEAKGRLEGIVEEEVHRATGLRIGELESLGRIQHSVTRYRITLDCFLSRAVRGRLAAQSEYVWVDFNRLKELPLSRSARQLTERLPNDPVELRKRSK